MASVPAAELKDAVGDSSAAGEFYKGDEWQAVWSQAGEGALREELAHRARHGLDRLAFLPKDLPPAPAQREVALTEAALTYAAALAHGVADPTELHEIYTIPRPEQNLVAGLRQALSERRLSGWLESLAPQDGEYSALSKAYLRYRQQASNGESAKIPSGDLVHQGESDPRVPAIRDRLSRLGYLDGADSSAASPAAGTTPSPQATPSPDRFTPDLADALGRFQQDSGIQVDKVIGPSTLTALNRGPEERARALVLALERRRWLVRTPPATRVDVNTAAATLEYIRDGKVVDRRKVIAGQPGKETPQLQAPMFRLVANPTWTIPRSIQHSELANVGSGYLRRHNMEWRNGWIVQLPGPDNSLGLVKFDLEDKYAIYLHDTPAKSLFDKNIRQQSHGCVRVEDALGFAELIAADEGITDKWHRARQKSKETFVPLPKSIPVRLLYHPTFVSGSGDVTFRQDIYGWDEDLAPQLGYAKSTSRRIYASVEDLGP